MSRREAEGLVMRSPAMALVERVARLYAKVPNPVVLVGPVGSGKTSLARWIHRASGRRGHLIEVGSGDLVGDLCFDMLFGHVPGAFTGAMARRSGLLAKARNGTVLIDDLALLAPSVQQALLGVLESGLYRQSGSDDEIEASCRFLFATTEDPHSLVAAGRLLPDLESRIGEFRINVPALSARVDDIMPIAARRAQRMLSAMGWDAAAHFDEAATHGLMSYGWPQNIRELESVVDVAVVHAGVRDGVVCVRRAHLPERFHEMQEAVGSGERLSSVTVEAMLRETRGNQSEAARRLKVHRNTVRKYARRRTSP